MNFHSSWFQHNRYEMEKMDFPKMDKTIVTIAPLTDPPSDKEFWLTKTPNERLQAVEYLRRLNYGERQCTARLQRVLEIARRSSG